MNTNCFGFYFFCFRWSGMGIRWLLVFVFTTMVWSVLPEVRFIEQNKKTVYYVTPCDKLYSVQFNFQLTRFAEKVFVVVVFINGVWDAQLMCIVVVTTWTLVPGLIQKGDFLIQLFHVQFVLKKSKTVKTDLVFPCT